MNLENFARTHQLKIKRDTYGDAIIPGKPRNAIRQEDRNHIYDHEDGQHFGLALMFTSSARYNHAKQRLLAAGFILRQNGDCEGNMLFNPENKQQAKTAIREAGARIRKPASPEVLARLARTAFKRTTPGVDIPLFA